MSTKYLEPYDYMASERRYRLWQKKDVLVRALETLPNGIDKQQAFKNLLEMNRAFDSALAVKPSNLQIDKDSTVLLSNPYIDLGLTFRHLYSF